MKIYISGKVSGFPFADVKSRFKAIQNFLERADVEVVNPLENGLTEMDTWEQHIVRDVELLLPCDAIYMLDGWKKSTGACIEHDIAVRTGKKVLFEVKDDKTHRAVMKIQNAIQEVTGMKFSEYGSMNATTH